MAFKTPAYIFDVDCFIKTINQFKEIIADHSLTYSMKANPVLAGYIPDDISYIEVCSHGEFGICKNKGIDGRKIIYSGVLKKEDEVLEALNYGVMYITAESIGQLKMINRLSKTLNVVANVLIRVSSGNQFGVSKDDLALIMDDRNENDGVSIEGIHYYSGTQKKRADLIERDLESIDTVVTFLRDTYDFECKLIEYGPGLAVDYFKNDRENLLDELIKQLMIAIEKYEWKSVLGFEFGRILASESGRYITKICDKKTTNGINYLIVDGGIHQLKYYGQNMAMQIPPVSISNDGISKEKYCICGSLCTTADVLIREIELPVANVGDCLTFMYCGAYSSTESPVLFLSRELANIYVTSKGEEFVIRDTISTSKINTIWEVK